MRTKNIWVVVFFHAIYDIASEFPLIFHKIPAGAVTDDSEPAEKLSPHV